MNGLKYILREIEARRTLLHDFVKGMETSKEFPLFSGDVPDIVKDGELIYRPNLEVEPYRTLTWETFRSSYQHQFMESQHYSRLLIPLKPNESPPDRHEINELLIYEFGDIGLTGYCQASLYMWLINPYLRQNDRKFYLIAEHRRTPSPIISYVKNGREWTYPGGFEIGDSELENLLIQSHPYARWKKDARKVRPRLKPVDNRSDIGGAAYVVEEDKIFTAPIILIEEDTTRERIWDKLLIYAWGSGYFKRNSTEENDAYTELRKCLLPQKYRNLPEDEVPDYIDDKIHRILEHFLSHTFSPYNTESSDSYLKKINIMTHKKIRYERSEGRKRSSKMIVDIGLPDNTKDDDTKGYEIQYSSPEEPREGEYSIHHLSYPPDSVPAVARQMGVPEWTIYRLIRQGDIEAIKNEEGYICLDDVAIAEVKQVAERNRRRKFIYEIAQEKGKSQAATKKWLQRHRNLSQEQMLTKIRHWLDIQTDLK
ncbi:hypothetical protein ACFLX1_01055 [Chloroflexota bacterium]